MDLETLARRLDHERDGDRRDEEVVMLTGSGRRYDILSLNWNEDANCWVLIGDLIR